MTNVHFLDLAALIGDVAARRQIKELREAVDPPTEVEVGAFLEHHLGRAGPFTAAQRREGRARLITLMVEQSLEQRLDWGKDDSWGEEDFQRSGDWPSVEEDEVAADADAGRTIPSDVTWSADEADSQPAMDWAKVTYPPEALVLAGETDSVPGAAEDISGAQNIVESWSLHTAEGPIIVSVDGASVYVRRPPGAATDRLRLGDNDYELDPKTGVDGMERVVGLSAPELKALIQKQSQGSDSLACDD